MILEVRGAGCDARGARCEMRVQGARCAVRLRRRKPGAGRPVRYILRMQYRTYPRTGWSVAEIGYGMWGMGGWTGSDDRQSHESLDEAIAAGCNFFDTAWAYGSGHSERLLGEALRRHRGHAPLHRHQSPTEELQVAGARRIHRSDEVFPAGPHPRVHRKEPDEPRRARRIDLQQFHVWSDTWADDDALEAGGGRSQARGADHELRASA